MYAEWTSLEAVFLSEQEQWSVLNKFPYSAARDVSIAVVKHLAANLGINSASAEQPSNLDTDREVHWCLEVLCYGLRLPLSETDAIRDCVNVYCEWLSSLTKPNSCVPRPIVEDPNNYGRTMIQHLYNLFVPRENASADQVHRQILYCHRVLRTLQMIANDSAVIDRETWEKLLMLLLSVNDTLLAPPPIKDDDIGDQLCERILSVLFEVWLTSCHRCFPSPPLWKTFREMACRWRHRVVLIDQWNRVNIALTSKLLSFMLGSTFPDLQINDEDTSSLLPSSMSNDCVAQSWFRFLHIVGNPVDLCKPGIISQTPRFFHYALSSEIVIDPWQHKCLMALPLIFLKATKGISTLVNAFLGVSVSPSHIEEILRADKIVPSVPTSATPPNQRKMSKNTSSGSASSKNVPKTLMGLSTSKSGSSQVNAQSSQPGSNASTPSAPTAAHHSLTFSQENSADLRSPCAPGRPRCNSILHLFRSWLFEASLLGCKIPPRRDDGSNEGFDDVDAKKKRRSSVFFDQKTSSIGMSSLPDSQNIPDGLSIENFEAGQAEAIGALCRIFCSKRTGEEILPVYLARFYLALQLNLTDTKTVRGQVISSIILNSRNLFKQDLEGVDVLVPAFVFALEMILPEAVPTFKLHQKVQPTDLRRAAIHHLLSILSLPLHFDDLGVNEIVKGTSSGRTPVTFHHLKCRLVNLLIGALKVETDSLNTQMLLGGMLLCVQDCAAVEELEQITVQNIDEPTIVASSDGRRQDVVDSSRNPRMNQRHSSPLHIDPESVEYPDFDSLSNCDTAHALFLRATYLVCHKLISSWKTDLNVSLAAIELLAGLAKIKPPDQDTLECKRAVKWIGDFIVYQCSRPPPAHSKDLHSTIVAAYQCVTTWLVEHPYLMEDKECLNVTLEVVELGISGAKSQPKLKDVPKMKAEKENKPVSMRVRDAAESVLTHIMNQVGYFPSPCGPQTLSSLLVEEDLLKQCNGRRSGTTTKDEIVSNFRYFVVDNSVILALLEQPLGNDQDPRPAITCLMRGPFGRHAWTMHLRHLPRYKSGCGAVNPGRPLPVADMGTRQTITAQYFPDSVDRIPTCDIDKSIPSLESVITDVGCGEHERISKLIDEQISFEDSENSKFDIRHRKYPNPETECFAPKPCDEFQTARLFLSHFGFLSLETLKESLTQPVPPLVLLDHSQQNFHETLTSLDKMSDRTSDTVYVFYMKSDQRDVDEILNNVTSKANVNPHFLEFLLSLGWPIDVVKHAGWTGNVQTSWKINGSRDLQEQLGSSNEGIHGGSLYDGHKQVLYWSDVSSEVAFIVPSVKKVRASSQTSPTDSNSASPIPSVKSLDLADERHGSRSKQRTLTLDLDQSNATAEQQSSTRSSLRKYGRQGNSAVCGDTKVLVVWLESFEDFAYFPTSEALNCVTSGSESSTPKSGDKDVFVIFVHSLKSGLFRIKMQGNMGKMTLAIPLVDGMIVSRRILGTMVRQTALNMCRRRRLELDSYQPPHVRRKIFVQDVVQKYRNKVDEPNFFTNLFL